MQVRSSISSWIIYCEGKAGLLSWSSRLACHVYFLFPGATVFSTGLNLLFTGLDMAAWPELKQPSFGHYPDETLFAQSFPI